MSGGNGGSGGDGTQFSGSGSGGGGEGEGVIFQDGGNITVTSTGAISGGNGGAGGSGGGAAGAGGVGIVGAGLTITNAGSITGGLAGDGATRADAVTFTGGANVLKLTGNGGLTGNIGTAAGSSVTFEQALAVTLANTITGGGAVVQNGTGTLTLTGANTYSGTTTVSASALNIQNANALGTTAGGTTVASGAALQTQGGITVGNEALALNGMGVGNDGALRSISGSNFYSGVVTLASASRINADSGTGLALAGITGTNMDLTLGGAGTVAVAGNITTGTGALTKDGAGMAQLFGVNRYSGATTISDGVLQLWGGQAIADTGAVFVNSAGTLRVEASETIGSLTGTGNVILSSAPTLTVGGDNTSTTYSGAISEALTSGGNLAKIGTGKLILAGTNTYTGITTVDGGTLSVNGSIASSSMTTVDTGGTLGGNGVVGNTTIAAGGTLAPGNSIGLLTVRGNLVLNAASSYMVEVSPSNADRVNVTGAATLGERRSMPCSLRGATSQSNTPSSTRQAASLGRLQGWSIRACHQASHRA